MAENYKFTNEARTVFNYIKQELLGSFPTQVITTRYFIYSIMCNKACNAYKTLERFLFSENLEAIKKAYEEVV